MKKTMYRLLTLLLAVPAAIGAHAQQSAEVAADDTTVTAGEDFKFTIALDVAPSFGGGSLEFQITGPEGVEHGAISSHMCRPRPTEPKVYDCVAHIYATAAGGIWTFTSLIFAEGTKIITLNFAPLALHVIPRHDLVFPASATITLNLSQSQLLRREAIRLEARIRKVASTLAEYGHSNSKDVLANVLQQNLKDEIHALETTEAEYLKLMTADDQSPAQAFFGDLHLNYDGTLALLQNGSSASYSASYKKKGPILLVADKHSEPKKQEVATLLALAVLRSFEQNEIAYKTVLESGSLLFDLEVNSHPAGAAVFYYRRGESPRQYPKQTNSTIHSLPFAIWNIRLEKEGYKAEETQYDPFRDPNRVITVQLKP